LDALESKSQLQTKKKTASTMMFKLVEFQANFFNNIKWTKTLITQVNIKIFEERSTKYSGTKVRAGREEEEAIHCLDSVSNSRTTF
jgi:hypothetical protein